MTSVVSWNRDCLLSVVSKAAASQGMNGLRSQPARSVKQRTTAARHYSVVVPRPALAESIVRTVVMSAFEAPPGELNACIISSILNLVCPQCGGRMSEFQCEGRCGRNWLAEWEWANQSTRSPKSQVRR